MFPFFWLILSVIICLKTWCENHLEVIVFSYRVAAHKAEDIQPRCLLRSAFEFGNICCVEVPFQMLLQVSLYCWAESRGETWQCSLLG